MTILAFLHACSVDSKLLMRMNPSSYLKTKETPYPRHFLRTCPKAFSNPNHGRRPGPLFSENCMAPGKIQSSRFRSLSQGLRVQEKFPRVLAEQVSLVAATTIHQEPDEIPASMSDSLFVVPNSSDDVPALCTCCCAVVVTHVATKIPARTL